MILATSVSMLLTAVSPVTPANAALQSCIPATTYLMNSRAAGWMPTDTASAWMIAPATIAYNQTSTVSTTYTYSGSATISISSVVAEASATYGYSYSPSTSYSAGWTYSAPSPSGTQARMLILRAADKLTFTKVVDNPNCTTTSTTGLIGYVPRGANSNAAYCIIMDVWPAKTTWKSTCSD